MVTLTPPTARLFDATTAAAYLGMSARTFDKHWRAGKLPAPHRIGRRLLWDRRLLDDFVDQLSGLGPPDPETYVW